MSNLNSLKQKNLIKALKVVNKLFLEEYEKSCKSYNATSLRIASEIIEERIKG